MGARKPVSPIVELICCLTTKRSPGASAGRVGSSLLGSDAMRWTLLLRAGKAGVGQTLNETVGARLYEGGWLSSMKERAVSRCG